MANEKLSKSANQSVAQPIRAHWKPTPVSFGPPHFFEMVNFTITHNGEPKNIQVHKAAACSCSPVFDAAFNGKFNEGETQTYILEDTELAVLKLLVEYMYNRDVRPQLLIDGNDLNEPQAIEETLNLLKLWVLADKFCIPKLQNQIIENLGRIMRKRKTVSIEWLDYVYAETTDGSALQRFFIKVGTAFKAGTIEEAAKWFPAAYLVAVLKELLLRSNYEFDEDGFSELLVPEV